jgi:hypothetical protein
MQILSWHFTPLLYLTEYFQIINYVIQLMYTGAKTRGYLIKVIAILVSVAVEEIKSG